MTKLLLRCLLFALLLFGSSPLLPAPALADTFPGAAGGIIADNATHTFCFATFPIDQSIATYAMDNLDSQTIMTDFRDSSCTGSTDVWWWEVDLPAGVRGQENCVSFITSTKCDSANAKLDIAEIDIGSNDWYDRRKTSVHELGHSVGLGEGTDDAMILGEVPSTSIQWRSYSAHHVSHINSAY